MCIRDSPRPHRRPVLLPGRTAGAAPDSAAAGAGAGAAPAAAAGIRGARSLADRRHGPVPVSYTHLTLPTSVLV